MGWTGWMGMEEVGWGRCVMDGVWTGQGSDRPRKAGGCVLLTGVMIWPQTSSDMPLDMLLAKSTKAGLSCGAPLNTRICGLKNMYTYIFRQLPIQGLKATPSSHQCYRFTVNTPFNQQATNASFPL